MLVNLDIDLMPTSENTVVGYQVRMNVNIPFKVFDVPTCFGANSSKYYILTILYTQIFSSVFDNCRLLKLKKAKRYELDFII